MRGDTRRIRPHRKKEKIPFGHNPLGGVPQRTSINDQTTTNNDLPMLTRILTAVWTSPSHSAAIAQRSGKNALSENLRTTDKVINKRLVSQPQRPVAHPRQ
jgi:hypothetical protein